VLIRLVARLPRGDATRGCGASFRHPQGDDDAKYGKVERLHVTFRPDFLDVEGPFTSVDEAQAAVDTGVIMIAGQKIALGPVKQCQHVPGAAILSGRPHPRRAADTCTHRGGCPEGTSDPRR
jgi:hypothetical protein